MRQMGKTQADVEKAVSALNNPFIAGIVNKISPNMSNILREFGGKLVSGGSLNLSNSQPVDNKNQFSGSGSTNVSGSTSSLRERLKNL